MCTVLDVIAEKAASGRKVGNKNLHNPLPVCNDNQGGDDNHGENDNTPDNPDAQTGVLLKTRPKTQKPAMYKVLILNDDYTPMEFVVYVIERFFNKTRQEATDIMLHVHRRGVGVCGIYTYEVAETKVAMVMDYARQNEQPLQCTMEKE
ncbi:MAG: ATP-dependent Clp protease adapter ClpS [Alphaproteobacteria bacterium]